MQWTDANPGLRVDVVLAPGLSFDFILNDLCTTFHNSFSPLGFVYLDIHPEITRSVDWNALTAKLLGGSPIPSSPSLCHLRALICADPRSAALIVRSRGPGIMFVREPAIDIGTSVNHIISGSVSSSPAPFALVPYTPTPTSFERGHGWRSPAVPGSHA